MTKSCLGVGFKGFHGNMYFKNESKSNLWLTAVSIGNNE